MGSIMFRLRKLRWRWRFLIIGLTIVIIIVVIVPAVYYWSRNQHPQDISGMPNLAELTYLVSYDSSDGNTKYNQQTIQAVEASVTLDSVPCFYLVTSYDPHPQRKFGARIVGSTMGTLGEEKIWRSSDDLCIVQKKVFHQDLPIVNTVRTTLTYSGYDHSPGWPYQMHDTWTYNITYDTNTPLQPSWTDTFRAEVVADDALVDIGDVQYQCFKVVHTLVDTTTSISPGGGVGSTIIEYWVTTSKSIGPVKVEDSVNFIGKETQIATGEVPAFP